ncbi:hypothetical protein BT63DRAFT_90213 [Microthyrium microscopicum]|uniref:DUF1772-domain-containing protein n=1 Tax=Microthyrium microscopicum TaxID=703497 RepID=A0A6A6TYG3_9PEZI|nr:hypothetical protein BT63DRAFT_90213 [Microthyrium microscopicum]
MALPTLTSLAKVAGISSSGIFAGYTWALSDAAMPAIIAASDEVTVARQWRIQYLKGFLIAMPATVINILSWSYLAYITSDTFARQLFVTAAVTTGSGTVFAWTALRYINGALAIKADKSAGPQQSIALNYSRKESGTKNLEAGHSTQELAAKWKQYNAFRSVILLLGTVVGAYALAL